MTDLLRDRLQTSLGAAYTIERELGGGGMARVFVAEDAALGRRIVVKVLAPELAEGLSAERFAREVRLSARLQHPNVVPVLAAGTGPDGLPYYTMPFIDGASLRERITAGPLPISDAIAVLRDMARALAYAHGQGVVHRDIKPENVLLTGGAAVVADFGIAKALSAAGSGATLTQLGMAVGTPAYMAPEQAAGDPDVDAPADVYAWGLVAYEALSGAHPFAERRTPQALLVAHLTEVPASLTIRSVHVPPALAAFIARCLAKDPAERPADGAAVVRALDALHAGALSPADHAASAPSDGVDARPGAGPGAGPRPASHAILAPPDSDNAASVAVLPFANLSADPENEFFSDGITEDVIGALTQLPGLRVAARTSAFAFKGRHDDLSTIGTKLGVRTVLQGSVRRAGSRVRVTAQLMDARGGHQLWSERFDRELEDIFAVQDEIARRIVEHLKLTMGFGATVPLVGRPTDDLEAYQLYLRAREAIQQRSHTSLQHGIQLLRRALGRDPAYARAWLGLAEAYIGLGVYQYIPPADARREAEAALAAAAESDPALPALPFFRAQLKLYLRADWRTAGDDLREALARQPQDALTHVYFAYWCGMMGDRASRAPAVRRALSLDPLSPFVHGIAGMSYLVTHDFDEALKLYAAGLALDPNSMLNLWQSAAALQQTGHLDEAIRRHTRAVELGQRSPILLAMLGQSLAAADRMDEAHAIRDEVDRRAQREYVAPVATFALDLALGDEERLVASLQRNVEAGTGPTTLVTALVGDIEQLLASQTLEPLVRRLSVYAEAPA